MRDKLKAIASPQATRRERICGNCGLPLVQTETEEACRELDKVSARLEARRAVQPAAGTTPRPKLYTHNLVCSGDRRKPPGTKGICCCCFNNEDWKWGYGAGLIDGGMPEKEVMKLLKLEATTPQAERPAPEIVIDICRELYDRFAMGGWEPQDAYPWLTERLGL